MSSWPAERDSYIYLALQIIVRVSECKGDATGRKCIFHKAEKGYRILMGKALGKRIAERKRTT
jgi:hypothetical protein